MNRYVLCGGRLTKGFFKELLYGTSNKVNFLVCKWAQPLDTTKPIRIQKASELVSVYNTREDFKYILSDTFPSKKFNVAVVRPERFLDQLQWANVIYFEGGTTVPLMDTLNTYHRWWKTIEGKSIGGNSAGANALCRFCYGLDAQQVLQSNGPVPIALLVHYLSNYNDYQYTDWARMSAELNGTKLKVLKLQEEQYQSFTY